MLFAWAAMAQSPWCVVEKPTTQAIQAAIDACSAKGGGTAYANRQGSMSRDLFG